MRRLVFGIMVCAMCLILGCGKEDDNITVSSEFNMDTDDQNFSALKEAVYTEEGFYFFDNTNNLLVFFDNETEKIVTLCGKPNCSHNNEGCDAFFLGACGVYSYENHIYVVADNIKDNTVCLYRLNRDGSERTEMATLFAVENEISFSPVFVIHKGYIYTSVSFYDDDEKTKDEAILFRMKLNGEEKKDILHLQEYEPHIFIINTAGDKMYICENYIEEKEVDSAIIENNYCYDVRKDNLGEIHVPEDHTLEFCTDKNIYSMTYGAPGEKGIHFYTSDIDGNNTIKVYSDDNAEECMLYNDFKYRYLVFKDNEIEKLRVLTYEGDEICTFEITDMKVLYSNQKEILLENVRKSKYFVYNIEEKIMKEATRLDL